MQTLSAHSKHDAVRAVPDGPPSHDHIFVVGRTRHSDFHRKSPVPAGTRMVDRAKQGARLAGEVSAAFGEHDDMDRAQDFFEAELRPYGTVLVLEGAEATYPLKLESLSNRTNHKKLADKKTRWLLLAVHPPTDDTPEEAVVWVADEYRAQFLKLFQDYLTQETRKGNPKRNDLVANIARIRTAVLEDLWTSDGEPVRSGERWWEVWLDATGDELAAMEQFASNFNLRLLDRSLAIGDRVVVWIYATWAELQVMPFTSVPVAELRSPSFVETVEDLSIPEQDEYALDLADRIVPAPNDRPAVCHLDSGVLRTHVLLEGSLAHEDHHTVIGENASDVHRHGHGTAMAGLALFGDLDRILLSQGDVPLRHRLESVRMLPSRTEPATDPRDYGSLTVEAVAMPEVSQPDRRRVFCLTLSSQPDRYGEPTLWSAAVDALAAGSSSVRSGEAFELIGDPDFDAARLIVVAGGNVDESDWAGGYPATCATSPIEDPAQAWNVLTVGASTELVDPPDHPQWQGWSTVAPAGALSPFSRTSLLFDSAKAPIKPEICMEGGNLLTDGGSQYEAAHPSVSLRTTGHKTDTSITSANATSAAAAQASRLAALASERYPDAWPETVRGLMVHAAEWTPAMKSEIDSDSRKRSRAAALRTFGWGVPSEADVLGSSLNAVTMVSQDEFVPFEGTDRRIRQFRLHTLPWPSAVLEELGAEEVRLRATLSYFIEPSPSRRGWGRRYAYASHALRFDLQGPTETQSEFVSRINRDAQNVEDGTVRGRTSQSSRWLLGEQQRHHGSLHQDDWYGSGIELAGCNSVAVYPVGGWWKNNSRAERVDHPVRYSLLLSLRTARTDVDLYTPVAVELGIPVETVIAGS